MTKRRASMKRIINALSNLNWGKRAYAVSVLCAATAITLPAQTFTTLHSFDGTDGATPLAGLVQATNGDGYGTTSQGGANVCADFSNCGTVFRITPSGTLTTLYSFCAQSGCADGYYPYDTPVQASNGDFYGTTSGGGANSYGGTVFKITPSGTLTTLYSFCSKSLCTDGGGPYAGLVQATNGDFYGTTVEGGTHGDGTVFKITPSGTLTTLHSFCAQVVGKICTDGYSPSGLVEATNGDFYGTTAGGGVKGNYGTVFRITPTGTLTTLHRFSFSIDGYSPNGGLVQAPNGDFYGTTTGGGANAEGTVFRITPSGRLTTLYSFCAQSGCADGNVPNTGLVLATDGNFYGTTYLGGASPFGGAGTVFKITPGGTLATLYSFCAQSGCTDGNAPSPGLAQATNGDFYGTTINGGANGIYGYGTVFSLSAGLGPFVKTQTTSGKVGAVVKILGSDLTGATSVSFNGTAATFTVVSRFLITTTVPAGASSGEVQVVTPSGTLSSNVPFRVLP